MNELAIATYLVVVVYVANFLTLSVVAARGAGRPVWLFDRAQGGRRLVAMALCVSFAVAFLWPGVRLATGGVGPGDPVTQLLQSLPAAITGHLLVALGAAVAVMSQYHMGASWRVGTAPGELGPLVDTGPFALSRNPVFLGQAGLLAGLVLAYPDLVELAAACLGWLAMMAQTRIEERVMRATYGADYEAYAARVPRWFGRVRRAVPGMPTRQEG